MQKLIFACTPVPRRSEQELILLIRSLRAFGGTLAEAPFWVLLPSQDALSADSWAELQRLEVRKYVFKLPPQVSGYPNSVRIFAAARAEALAQSRGDLLAWLDTDTLVLHEPLEFLIPAGKSLGSRPVRLKNISSPYDQPLDRFWDIIYRTCGTRQDNIFPMTTIDGIRIRPQFSTGLVVVRPELGLLGDWRANFLELYQHPLLRDPYLKHPLYRLFIHQAVLAGSVLAKYGRTQVVDFSNRVNYPIHQHGGIPAVRRPLKLNDLVTCRYGGFATFFSDPNWSGRIKIDEPLRGWLENQLAGLVPGNGRNS